MRVLFVAPHLAVGGAQRQWSLLLPELARRGLEPVLLTLEARGEFFDAVRSAGVRAECAGMRKRSDLRGLRRALRLGDCRPAAVVSQGVGAHVIGRLLSRRTGAVHVVVDHRAPGFPFSLHREVVLRVVAPRVDRVVAVSARQVPQLLARRFRPDRILVIPNGVDEDGLRPTAEREELRARLGVPDGGFAALFLSVLRPEKRADRFVAAVVRAHALDPRIRGLLAGRGPELERIRRLTAAANGAVSVLGHRDDVADLLAAADVVCLTSDAEAAPMSALEAMAVGRPVLSTRVGSVDEVVADGETGILVPPDVQAVADALAGLARDPARAAELGRGGQAVQRERFRVEQMADAYARALLELGAFESASLAGKAAQW